MQLFTCLGRSWDLSSFRPLFNSLISRLPIEYFTLFSFIFVAQQFINECKFAILIHILWTAVIYLIYVLRSHFNLNEFNQQLNLDLSELIDLFNQLPNCDIFKDRLFTNYQSSIEWINCLLAMCWPKLAIFFNKKFRKFNFILIKFFTLANYSIGLQSPLIESLSSSLITHNHEDTLILNFSLYWFAKSGGKITSKSTSNTLVSLKFFNFSIGNLISFCLKANCQLQFKFMQWQLNEEIQLKDIQFSFTQTPNLPFLNATGLIWLLDSLQLVRPIIYIYLKHCLVYPKCATFKLKNEHSAKIEQRRPQVGCPIALLCLDVIQAENLPMIRIRRAESDKEQPSKDRIGIRDQENKDQAEQEQASKIQTGKNQVTQAKKSKKSDLNRKCRLFKCFNYQLPSAYCKVKILNQQFTSSSIGNSANPFWNHRCLLPIFSHNKNSIVQLNKYHSIFNKSQDLNPIDLNASFYQFQDTASQKKQQFANFKNLIFFELLDNLVINIQLLNKEDNKQIADFQIIDSKQYFLDKEFNGQSTWINSTSQGVQSNVVESIKLNVRFSFLTLNQTLDSIILSNAYLANRLAFPIGVLLVFLDSAIGLNVESLKSSLNSKGEFGYQIVCQLGNQILYTSICADSSFIWENELLFCVYSLHLEKMIIKLIARNTSNYELTTIASTKLNLSNLIYKSNLTLQHYCPLYLKSNSSFQLKCLLTFRIINFSTKLITNCLRNAKVAEEDILFKEKHVDEENLRTNLNIKQALQNELPVDQPATAENLISDNKKIGSNELNQTNDSNEFEQTANSIDQQPNELKATEQVDINLELLVRMSWPKQSRLLIEIVDLKCKSLTKLKEKLLIFG